MTLQAEALNKVHFSDQNELGFEMYEVEEIKLERQAEVQSWRSLDIMLWKTDFILST